MPLDHKDAVYWQEDFTIVHDGLGRDENLERAFETFVRGHPITWGGLVNKYDIRRDYFGDLVDAVETLIHANVNRTLNLYHAPGAGGTTLGLRLAWYFRRRFPTVVVKRHSPHLVDRLHALSTVTNLRLLILLDAGTVSFSDMQDIYTSVTRTFVSALLVQVGRGSAYTAEARRRRQLYMDEAMSDKETDRFVQLYTPYATASVLNELNLLRADDSLVRYRTPFFFGVTVFGEGYRRLEQRIQDALDNSNPAARTLIVTLAFCALYSPRPVPLALANVLLGRKPRGRVDVASDVGTYARSFVIQDNVSVRISHPVIVEAILKQLFGVASIDIAGWGVHVPGIADTLISAAAQAEFVIGDITELLQDIFIQRARFYEDAPFSPLMSALSAHAARAIFDTLLKHFPENDHFHHHCGRLYDRKIKLPLSECLPPMLEAARLNPNEEIHQHGLGMVYRSEMFRLDKEIRLCNEDTSRLPELCAHINRAFQRASDAFGEAKRLGPVSEYGYVSHIQMNLDIVDAFVVASGVRTLPELLRRHEPYVAWCSELLSDAKTQLYQVQRLNPERITLSRRVHDCRIKIDMVKGDVERAIFQYGALLSDPKVIPKDWVRYQVCRL